MLVRRAGLRIATTAVLVTMSLVAAQGAAAHGGEHHPAPGGDAAATGGGAAAATAPAAGGAPSAGAEANAAMPPVVGGGGAGGAAVQPTAPANDRNAPAPGAQPAAPAAAPVPAVAADAAADPADVAADAAGVEPGDAVEVLEVGVDEEVAAPVEAKTESEAAAPLTVDGGGTHEGHSNAGGGGHAVAPAADPVAPSGMLPFTGLAENLMVVALAGMFVPIGVLLYCGARSGERRARLRHLSMPRFQWAESPRQYWR